MKVLTTYAALTKLGFSYRWPTKFYYTGRLQNGKLSGDLIVQAFGDPTLHEKDLTHIISMLHVKGITSIQGNIIIDRSYFNVGNKNCSGFDKNLYSAYNAMPDAMMFSERISTVCVVPNKNKIYPKYGDKSYAIVDQLKRVNKPCRGRYAWPRVSIDNSTNIPAVILKGKISKRCGKRNICKVLTKPYRTFYYALTNKMRENHIRFNGRLHLKKVPPHAKRLFTHYSQTLEKIISKTAKKSNNLYARHLLLLLGAKVYGAPATLSKGRKAVWQILSSRMGYGLGRFKIDNGSGLSRSAKLSAKGLVRVLEDAHKTYGKRWMQTLSIAGVDGTIKKRFRGSVVQNRAWMKTGTLKHVKNIAGYVKSRSGKWYVLSILVNSKKSKYRGAKLQNEMIKWLVNGTQKSSVAHRMKKHKAKRAKHGVDYASKRYYVQVGSFKRKPHQKYLQKLSRLGLPYVVKRSKIYKVLVGPYKKSSTAHRILKKVKRSVNKSAFITKL
jgi:D-alanyl-D-alanine carboxypeptidase/D-alanyl-D-alanine-endopeptidase (penicillin-binding protein 4)